MVKKSRHLGVAQDIIQEGTPFDHRASFVTHMPTTVQFKVNINVYHARNSLVA